MSTSSVVSLEHNLELEEPNIKQRSFYGWSIITESLYYIWGLLIQIMALQVTWGVVERQLESREQNSSSGCTIN